MRFLRHLLAASALVALVIALGFVWKGSSAASLVSDDRGQRPPGAAPGRAPAGAPVNRGLDQRDSSGISFANGDDLVQTLVVEGLIIGGVVGADVARRRRRRAVFAMKVTRGDARHERAGFAPSSRPIEADEAVRPRCAASELS